MKRLYCITFVLLLLFGLVQAEENPAVIVLTGHTKDVTFAAFSPDGKKVITSSLDNTASIWDWKQYVPPVVRPKISDF
jgi:WD40 repeat protein